jgi:hypothetical protein
MDKSSYNHRGTLWRQETSLELKIMLVGIACAISALIATATFVKWWQVKVASHWLPTPGKIVSARVVARTVTSISNDSSSQGAS